MRVRDGQRRLAAIALALLICGVLPPGVAAGDEEDKWKFGWSNGFKLDSADGKFKLKFGGRVQADWSWVDADDDLQALVASINGGDTMEDGNEFRRARLFFQGTIYDRVEFKAQYDFAGGDASFKDVYFGILDTPIGDIRVGHFKEPFSLEELTSGKYITFLERSLPNTFSPSRNTGIMVHDRRGERFTWAVGAFREADDFGETGDGEGKLNLSARVTGLPVYRDEGRRLIHLGLSASQKDLGDDDFRFRERPEAHLSPRIVDTGSFAGERFDLVDLEFALVHGPLWFAAEHTLAEGDAALSGDPSFSGSYVQAGFFLTGEHRVYKTSEATFDRLKPRRDFGEGPGAWEVALRYSTLDLTDGALAGGEVDDLSLALNWYLNPATRMMLNYVHTERDELADGTADFLLLRFQVDF